MGWRRRAIRDPNRLGRSWDVDPVRAEPARFDGPTLALAAPGRGLGPELAALSAELSIAGSRARVRSQGASGPNGASLAPGANFAAALRERLLARYPAAVAAVAAVASVGASAGTGNLTGATVTSSPTPRAVPLFHRIAAPRWTALVAAAAIVVAAAGVTTGDIARTADARITTATDASVIHAAVVRLGTAGDPLEAGDVVSVAAGGRAVVRIDGTEVRLGPGAALQLDRLDAAAVVVIQLAGRAYHRVDLGADGTYAVRTAGITWTTRGATFDVDRSTAADGEQVIVTALERSVAIGGPDLSASLIAGRQATIGVGRDATDLSTRATDAARLADPWLVENARLDADPFSVGVTATTR